MADEKYVSVGTDDSGNPFLLDTETMGKNDSLFANEVIKVYQVRNGLMFEIVLQPACGDEQLSLVGSRIYRNGIKISETPQDGKLVARSNTPGSNAMKYYCHSINARGW